jgi:ABC-type multidrug transport system permease subunit
VAARFVWESARKDLRRRLRDLLSLLLWIGIPLVIGGLILLVSSGGGSSGPKARVWLADQDDTFLSELLARGLESAGDASPFEIELVEEAEGRARLERGEGSALLVLPTGLSRALLEETPCELRLVTNPAQRILPGMIEEALSLLTDGVFYAQRILGDAARAQLRRFADGPPAGAVVFPDREVADFSLLVNHTIERLEATLFPPVIELETASETDEAPFDFGLAFFPGMLFMALFFVAQGLSDDPWRERMQGTLRRVAGSPQPLGLFLAGKLLAAALVVGPVCLVGLVLGVASFGFAPGRAALALVFGTLAGTALAALMTLIQLFATSQRAGHLLTNLVLFPLIMIGGSFFPFEAMPDWMARIGRRTPNGWALERFRGMLDGRAGPDETALAFALVTAALGLLALAAGARLKRRFARG